MKQSNWEFKNCTSLPFITKNNGYEISVYDQEMRGPIFNDHQKIKKIIFKKMEEDNKKGKKVSILLLNSQYKRVQKSIGQFSWLFLRWIRKSPKISVMYYI